MHILHIKNFVFTVESEDSIKIGWKVNGTFSNFLEYEKISEENHLIKQLKQDLHTASITSNKSYVICYLSQKQEYCETDETTNFVFGFLHKDLK